MLATPLKPYRPAYLSVAKVALYVTCPAQFKRQYVDGLVRPTNRYMAFGKAFHAALEAEHRGENSERALIAAWNTGESILAATGQAMHPGKAHALALLDEYKALGLGGALGEPEKKFSLRLLSPELPPVLGYIDHPIPERRRFREFKTTSSSTRWTPVRIAQEYQLHVYGRAYQRLYSHRPDLAEYVIFRTDIVQVDVVEAAPSADGFRMFEQAAKLTWEGICSGRYEPCGECELCKPPREKPASGPRVEWEDEAS